VGLHGGGQSDAVSLTALPAPVLAVGNVGRRPLLNAPLPRSAHPRASGAREPQRTGGYVRVSARWRQRRTSMPLGAAGSIAL